MKKTIVLVLFLCASGCVPSYAQIRERCEKRFDYDTPRYQDCVSDGQADAEHKRAALRAMGEGLQQAGQSMQRNTQQVNCDTNCSFGTCYTHCR